MLDRTKKYEFLGEIYEWKFASGLWSSGIHNWTYEDFQLFYTNKLVNEMRAPIVGRGVISFDSVGMRKGGSYLFADLNLTSEHVRGKQFEVIATEILPYSISKPVVNEVKEREPMTFEGEEIYDKRGQPVKFYAPEPSHRPNKRYHVKYTEIL